MALKNTKASKQPNSNVNPGIISHITGVGRRERPIVIASSCSSWKIGELLLKLHSFSSPENEKRMHSWSRLRKSFVAFTGNSLGFMTDEQVGEKQRTR